MADDSFPPTRWSIVLRARGPLLDGSDAGAAFRDLYLIYRPALYSWARTHGLIREDAEDAVQSFWLQASSGTLFENAESSRGRLRDYLRSAFSKHLRNLRRTEDAIKRGGPSKPVSMNDPLWAAVERELVNPGRTPDRMYDYFCALAVWRQAVESLREEVTAKDGPELAEALIRRLDPVNADASPVHEAAARVGLAPNTFSQRLLRLRQRFRAVLEDIVRATLDDPSPEMLAAELESLCQALEA